MNRQKIFKKKIFSAIVFSILSSILLIIHGVFFDLDTSQIERLTIGGFITTFILVIIGLLILDHIFDIEDHEKFKNLEKRIKKLETKKK